MSLYASNDSPLGNQNYTLYELDYKNVHFGFSLEKYYTSDGREYEVYHPRGCDRDVDYVDRFDEWMDSWPNDEWAGDGDTGYWYNKRHTKYQHKQQKQKKMF